MFSFPFRHKYCCVLCRVKANVVRLYGLKNSGHMFPSSCKLSLYSLWRDRLATPIININNGSDDPAEGFQSRKLQMVQPTMTAPGMGRSKVVFQIWPQDPKDSLSPTTFEPAFLSLNGESKYMLREERNIKNKDAWIDNLSNSNQPKSNQVNLTCRFSPCISST